MLSKFPALDSKTRLFLFEKNRLGQQKGQTGERDFFPFPLSLWGFSAFKLSFLSDFTRSGWFFGFLSFKRLLADKSYRYDKNPGKK